VIGTEYEPAKSQAARTHFAEAGLSAFIDARGGSSRNSEEHRRRGGLHAGDIWTPRAPCTRARGTASEDRRNCGLDTPQTTGTTIAIISSSSAP